MERHGERLGLVLWLHSRAALARMLPIQMDAVPAVHVSALVAHMNLIRPNRVQVLGGAELAYLRGPGASGPGAHAGHLLDSRPLCLVVADGLDAA